MARSTRVVTDTALARPSRLTRMKIFTPQKKVGEPGIKQARPGGFFLFKATTWGSVAHLVLFFSFSWGP